MAVLTTSAPYVNKVNIGGNRRAAIVALSDVATATISGREVTAITLGAGVDPIEVKFDKGEFKEAGADPKNNLSSKQTFVMTTQQLTEAQCQAIIELKGVQALCLVIQDQQGEMQIMGIMPEGLAYTQPCDAVYLGPWERNSGVEKGDLNKLTLTFMCDSNYPCLPFTGTYPTA